jgi:signal transduction histidine kinase
MPPLEGGTGSDAEARLAYALASKDRQLRLEAAISRSARALLSEPGEDGLVVTLTALLEVTGAVYTGVKWQGKEPAIIVSQDPSRDDELAAYWTLLRWDGLPSMCDRLASGTSVAFTIDDLVPAEAALYASAPEAPGAGINVPILMGDRWIGTLLVADRDPGHRFEDDERATLEMAASLLASWMDRRQAANRVAQAMAARGRMAQLERAVAAVSQVLAKAEDPDPLGTALAALLEATDATSAFIERNVLDPERGLCSSVVSSVLRPGAGYDPTYWDMMPWSNMPTTFAALSEGRPAFVTSDTLEDREAITYAGSPVRSEIDMPISVDGHWVGLIGLGDERPTRRWDDELEMLRTAAELVAAFWSRADSRRRLEHLVRSKDEFIASISHELRTPVTAILGMAETLRERREDLSDQEAVELVAVIAEQSGELAAIVSDLLVAARADIGQLHVNAERVDLRQETEAVLRGLSRTHHMDVPIDGDATAIADPLRLRQIVRNLASNANRYGGGSIKVRLSRPGRWARLEFHDNGTGIDPEDRQRIFLPYQRAHQRYGQPASVGLGLTVSRQLAELMGGSLDYERIDGWSCFVLVLPAA